MDYKEYHRLNEEFLKLFPLEKLKDMTLEQYTNLNRMDSFCYWVEFKLGILGSVSGNTSYKFGIYQYNQKPKGNKGSILYDDKYTWYSSLGATANEAFDNVKRAVISAAENGRNGNYEAIESINSLSPLIKWKIAFLYSNETIIPYYSIDRLRVIGEKMGMSNTANASIADIQRFLIDKRNGKDIHEYGKVLNELWNENNKNANSDHKKVWMYKRYEDAFAIDHIRMGSDAKGKLDFSTFKTKKALGDAYRKVAGNTDVAIPNMYWQLIKEVKPGDIVVVFDSQKGKGGKVSHLLYGWGRVTSEVIFDKNDDNPIHRKVEWHKPLPQEPIMEDMTNNTRYFHEVKGIEAANIMNLLGINKEENTTMEKGNIDTYIHLLRTNKNLVLTGAPGTGKTYLAKEIAKQILNIEDDDELQKDKRFGFVQFHPSYDYTDFVEGLRPIKDRLDNISFRRQDGIFKAFCKQAIFDHQLFYKLYNGIAQDLLSGKLNFDTDRYKYIAKLSDDNYRITLKDIDAKTGNEQKKGLNIEKIRIVFEYFMSHPEDWPSKVTKDGFNDIVAKSNIEGKSIEYYTKPIIEELWRRRGQSNKLIRHDKFVFIIDEINRGEISKIFGELFFSIDPGYRGVAGRVKTQYQNLIEEGDAFKDGFYVPENVYIIGTMNDIDRSVESMDFAMRRRFAWKEVTAEDSMKMLDGIEYEEESKKRMQNLNAAIIKVRGLGEAYQIGAAYFKKIKDYGGDFQKLWDFHLKGLLFEYLRGNLNAEEQLEELKKAYDN